MKLSINIKGLSRKKVIHQEEIEILNEISTTKDLIKEKIFKDYLYNKPVTYLPYDVLD